MLKMGMRNFFYISNHHSMAIARIIGPTNPISVLATLFLLSFTKLFRTIIATLTFTSLDYSNDRSVLVPKASTHLPNNHALQNGGALEQKSPKSCIYDLLLFYKLKKVNPLLHDCQTYFLTAKTWKYSQT